MRRHVGNVPTGRLSSSRGVHAGPRDVDVPSALHAGAVGRRRACIPVPLTETVDCSGSRTDQSSDASTLARTATAARQRELREAHRLFTEMGATARAEQRSPNDDDVKGEARYEHEQRDLNPLGVPVALIALLTPLPSD